MQSPNGYYQYSPYEFALAPKYVPTPAQTLEMKPKKHIFKAPPNQSNSLFIKNLPYNLNSDEFMKIFNQFGEIASTSLHIQNKGYAFVTYYDMRAAVKAKNSLVDLNVYNRHPIIDFSYKPPKYSKINPFETSSVLKIRFLDHLSRSSISKEDLSKTFSTFGDIYEIIDNSERDSSFLVKFYDIRSAKSAFYKITETSSFEINGIKLTCELFADSEDSVVYNDNTSYQQQSMNYLNNFQYSYPYPYQQQPYQYSVYSPPPSEGPSPFVQKQIQINAQPQYSDRPYDVYQQTPNSPQRYQPETEPSPKKMDERTASLTAAIKKLAALRKK